MDERAVRLCDAGYIRGLLARSQFHFSRAKGQNFLIDARVPAEIVARAGISKEHGVLEVGPGVGALTWPLALSAGRVAAVEVDERLRPVLGETLAGADNVTVCWGDVLRLDVKKLVEAHLPGLIPVVCANLPYAVTTPVLTRLLEAETFESVTVMVQKEVALRIYARPGTSDYGAFSVFARVYAEPEILFDVPPHCFTPRPKVTSSVVRLVCRKQSLSDGALFFKVVRAAFGQRRKTLLNALSSVFPLDRETLGGVLSQSGIPPAARGETLDITAFDRLTSAMADALKNRLMSTEMGKDGNRGG